MGLCLDGQGLREHRPCVSGVVAELEVAVVLAQEQADALAAEVDDEL